MTIFIHILVWILSIIFFHITFNIYYLIPVWIILGFIIAFLFNGLILILMYPFLRFTKYDNIIKHKYFFDLFRYAFFLTRVRIKVYGKENIPSNKFLLVGNHKSHFDIPIVGLAVKKPMGYVSKKEFYEKRFINMYMKTFKCIPVDRSDDRSALLSFKEGIKVLKEGYNLCVFPEGGIKDRSTEKMVGVKPGAYKLATKSGASILPVSIKNNSIIRKRLLWKKTIVEVYIHKPITEDDYKDLNTIEIGDLVFETVNKCLE